MKLHQKNIDLIRFPYSIFVIVFAAWTLSSCAKKETSNFPAPSPPKAQDNPVNPDDFSGCKRECLKGGIFCVKMSASVFGDYRKDLENFFSDAGKIPTDQEAQISISNDSFLDMKYMTISSTSGIPVRQHNIDDPDLEILLVNGTTQPVFKFKSSVVDSDYGGPISRIQYHQGLPIFTTGNDRCVGVF